MAQSWLCSMCSQAPALTFCYCNRAETLLCDGCLPMHFSKNPGRFHQNLPLSAFGPHRSPGYFERLQSRLEALETGKEALQQDVDAVDKCIAEFSEKVNGVMKAVWEYGEAKLGELRKMRGEMAAMLEAENWVYEDEQALRSDHAVNLWRSQTPHQPVRFWYQIDCISVPQSMIELKYSLKEAGKILEDFPKDVRNDCVGEVLPMIYQNSLKCYNVRTEVTTSSTLPVRFSAGTRFCLIDPDHVLCVGSSPPSKDVQLLTLSSSGIAQQAPMITARGEGSAVKLGSFVYVFGGWDGQRYLDECEKFDIEAKVWTELPNMDRNCINPGPAIVGTQIYLPTPSHSLALQVFDESNQSLKTVSTASVRRNISLIVGGKLFVLFAGKQIMRVNLDSLNTNTVKAIAMSSETSVQSNISPMRFGRKIAWVNSSNGRLVQFDIDAQTVID